MKRHLESVHGVQVGGGQAAGAGAAGHQDADALVPGAAAAAERADSRPNPPGGRLGEKQAAAQGGEWEVN